MKLPGVISLRNALPDLGDAERHLHARAVEHVLEVHVGALGRLGPQVRDRALVLHRPHVRLEHEVELARLGELAFHAADGALGLRPRPRPPLAAASSSGNSSARKRRWQFWHSTSGSEKVETWPLVTQTCGMHEDAGVEADDLVVLPHHRRPPGVAEVVLQLHAQRTVVVDRLHAAVDLGGLEDEAAALAQGDELVHPALRMRRLAAAGSSKSVVSVVI